MEMGVGGGEQQEAQGARLGVLFNSGQPHYTWVYVGLSILEPAATTKESNDQDQEAEGDF